MNKKPAKNPAPPADAPPRRLRRAGRRAAGVAGLAVVLGLAFNAASPLGVRWRETPETTQAPPASPPAPPAPAAPGAPVVPAPPAGSNAPASPPAGPEGAKGGKPAGPAFITPTLTHWREVKPLARAGKLVLVDARKPAAYRAGHIPGAVSLPENSPPGVFADFRRRYPPNTHLVVYCSSQSCPLSFKLAYRLAKEFGYTHVQFMSGGYLEYQREEGLARAPVIARPVNRAAPSAKAAPAATGATARATPPRDDANPMAISWARALRWRTELGAVLVDARSASAYAAGHVPGAVSLPWESAPAQYAAFAKRFGTERPVVVYGDRRGEVACFSVARKLLRDYGFQTARFIYEGYQEWRTSQDKPTGHP